jgi:hypothetical protein
MKKQFMRIAEISWKGRPWVFIFSSYLRSGSREKQQSYSEGRFVDPSSINLKNRNNKSFPG